LSIADLGIYSYIFYKHILFYSILFTCLDLCLEPFDVLLLPLLPLVAQALTLLLPLLSSFFRKEK
jgi:hypothetical protein